MISLFKRDQAYKIALSQQSKPTEPIYLCDLTKLQFKTRLLTDTASSEDSATVTPQSEESIIIRALAAEPLDAGASASQPSLSQDNIEDTYQFYI